LRSAIPGSSWPAIPGQALNAPIGNSPADLQEIFYFNACPGIPHVSNARFARPDLASLLDGLKFIQDKDYPIRGTLAP